LLLFTKRIHDWILATTGSSVDRRIFFAFYMVAHPFDKKNDNAHMSVFKIYFWGGQASKLSDKIMGIRCERELEKD
jgi:hypothetical protein